jgi:hypothetical protein
MNDASRTTTIVKVLLTVVALEFFGPILRDYSASHAFNPTWVGHARLHLVWLLGFMFLSGVANVYLIWFRRPYDAGNLRLSILWQACNLGGFWLAYALAPSYGGIITLPDTHVHILGYDENVFVFTILTVILVFAAVLFATATTKDERHAVA